MEKTDLLNALKREDGDVVDLIGNMPDDILVLILSRLESTGEAIRSSILSRRWRYLWTAIPSVDLHIPYSESDEQYENNKDFVCRVLGKISVDLDSFRLYGRGYYNMSTVGRWIHMAVAKNVKQLNLIFNEDIDIAIDIMMPRCLVTCASLEVLSLSSRGLLTLPSFLGFPALRVLKLENVELFDVGLVNYFLESCPLLEDLTFQDCIGKLGLLCISCPNLKKLTIFLIGMDDDDLCGCLKLSCPKLVSLDLRGQIASEFIFERLYSLKEAVIDPQGNTIHQLLLGISNVEYLSTDLHFLYEHIDDAHDPALPNLKTLELKSKYPAYNVEPLIQVLKYCPILESLGLTVEKACSNDPMEYDAPKFLELDEAETRPILTPDLKSIEFFEFNGEKPNVVIKDGMYDRSYIVARWGKEVR